jgi:hypothetical protein
VRFSLFLILSSLSQAEAPLGAPVHRDLAQATSSAQADAATAQDKPALEKAGVCATGKDSQLSFHELDDLLLLRHARSPRGREILRHLLEGHLVDEIAKERGVGAKQSEIEAHIELLEQQIISSGQAKDLNQYLVDSGVALEIFRDYMRLAVLQESLTRLSLGIEEGGNVTGEQQTAWLDSEIEKRGLKEPWQDLPDKDGVVLICAPVELKTSEFLSHLRAQLPPAELSETCYHLLLARRISARMPDMAQTEIDKAIAQEIKRRRLVAESDPAYSGVGFERLLASQGLTLTSLQRDPSVTIAALSGLYIDEVYSEEGLRAAYNTERVFFDGYYGEALGVRAILLQANLFPNEFIPRTFEAAERELLKLMALVSSEEDFLAFAQEHSEAKGKLAKGALHWMPLLDKQIGSELLSEAFSRWGGRPEIPTLPSERLLGPRRTPKGHAVIWLSGRRPAPAWKTMAVYVRQELRKRFIEEVLKPSEVVLTID